MTQIQKIQTIEELKKCGGVLMKAYNSEPWNDSWSKEKALEKLTCFYNSPKFSGWVAIENGEFLGGCVGNIEPYFSGDYFYLKELFVLPEAQRKGIGSKLLTVMNEYLKLIEINTVIIFTSNESFPFKFYQKTGFVEMDGMRMMSLDISSKKNTKESS